MNRGWVAAVVVSALGGWQSSALGEDEPVIGTSGPGRVAVVELFTSEGCSSCPPAEQWMNRLKGAAGVWMEFVPIVFHVDYWDGLGWADRFADAAFTQRQRAYAAVWKSRQVYTPGLVVAGREWRGWHGAQRPPKITEAVGMLTVVQESDGLMVRFEPEPSLADRNAWEAHAAQLAFGEVTKVARGENRGSHLEHDFVVRTWGRAPMRQVADRWEGRVRGSVSAGQGWAVWVSTGLDPTPVQAWGGWVSD